MIANNDKHEIDSKERISMKNLSIAKISEMGKYITIILLISIMAFMAISGVSNDKIDILIVFAIISLLSSKGYDSIAEKLAR